MSPDPDRSQDLAGCWSPGATGFLGRAVAAALAGAGHDVVRGARAIAGRRRRRGVGRLRRRRPGIPRWDGALDGIDVVVHLAGLAHLPDEMAAAAADAFARVNAEGTARLAAAAAHAGVRRFVLMSSALVHGAGEPRAALHRGRRAGAGNALCALQARLSERRLTAAARGSALQWVDPAPADGVRRRGARQLPPSGQLVRAGVPLPLGAATAPKSFIGIDNLADAVVRAVEHPRAAGQVFLVGRRGDHVDRGPHPPHCRRARPPRVDAARPAGATAHPRSRLAGRARDCRSACSIRWSSTPAASARCSTGRRRSRWPRACAAPSRRSAAAHSKAASTGTR